MSAPHHHKFLMLESQWRNHERDGPPLAAKSAETYVRLIQLSAGNRKMMYAPNRIVGWAKGAVIVLWFFSAPFLFIHGVILMDMPSGEQISPTEMLYGLFFVGTWLWSLYWIYAALFKLAEARWPRAREIKQVIDLFLICLFSAPLP